MVSWLVNGAVYQLSPTSLILHVQNEVYQAEVASAPELPNVTPLPHNPSFFGRIEAVKSKL